MTQDTLKNEVVKRALLSIQHQDISDVATDIGVQYTDQDLFEIRHDILHSARHLRQNTYK